VVSWVEEMSNYLARMLAVTQAGQGGREKSDIASLTEGQSKRAQFGVRRGSIMVGGCRITTISTWSKK